MVIALILLGRYTQLTFGSQIERYRLILHISSERSVIALLTFDGKKEMATFSLMGLPTLWSVARRKHLPTFASAKMLLLSFSVLQRFGVRAWTITDSAQPIKFLVTFVAG